MSDGASSKINTDTLEKKIKIITDFTKNFKPFFLKALGSGPESDPWTIRGGVHYTFENSVSPSGKPFKPLNDIYKSWKDKHFSPDLPILMRAQWLYDSLVHTNADSVLQMSPKKMVYGTKVPYAGTQHFGFKPKNIQARPFMGWRKNQAQRVQLELRQYVLDAFKLQGMRK